MSHNTRKGTLRHVPPAMIKFSLNEYCSDCMDWQAGLSLHWAYISDCTVSHIAAQIFIWTSYLSRDTLQYNYLMNWTNFLNSCYAE